MDEYFEYDETDDEIIEHMIMEGYIEIAGFDKDGGLVYRMTKKMIEDFPEVVEEHMAFTNEIVFSVWQKGFLEVTMTEDGAWTILENEKTKRFMEYEDQLTKEEWLLMLEVNSMINKKQI